MEFIKKHTSLVVAIGIFILAFTGFLILKSVFFPSEAKAIYGDRLKGRDKVIISDATKNKVKTNLSDSTSKVDVRVAGKIIYIDMTVTGNVNVAAAKDLANKALESFSDQEKAFYDIQAIISSDTDTTHFPIIGYKHHAKTAYSWTKDR
ncbi:MAG: hypothetical protein IJI58_04940 [Bacilli bacterium]|nr:hypothetical protein [Bacilli bacterium]